jgi:hypothetical protein
MILVPAGSSDLLGADEGGADEAPVGKGELLGIVGLADVGLPELVGPGVDEALQPTTSRHKGRTRRHMRQVCGRGGPNDSYRTVTTDRRITIVPAAFA